MFRCIRKSWLASLATACLLLTACVPRAVGPDAPPPAPTAKVAALGGEYVIHVPTDPDILNPYFGKSAYGGTVTGQVLGPGLLFINEKNEPAPWMAREWTVSPDGLVWTFTLRDDIRFHDGQPLTAADVVFSYRIPLDPDYVGGARSAFSVIREIEALDDHTVRITLKEVFAPFMFTTLTYPILPRHAFPAGMSVKEMPGHEFSRKPFGAGPYRFVEWKPGQHVLLEANSDFFRAKEGLGPYIQTYRIRVIAETQTAMAALEAGELDGMSSPEAQYVDRLKQEFKHRLNAYDYERNGFGYMTLNTEQFPTSERAVRQAMSMALNKQAILRGPLDGKAKIPAGPIPPLSWAYDPSVQGWPHDPARAARLLDESGFRRGPQGIREKDGRPLVIDYYATKGSPLIEAIALQAKKDWTALGFEVNVNFVEFNILLEKHMEPGYFHVTFSGFGLGVDPDSFYHIYHSSNARKNDQGLVKGNNMARYANPDVDRLLEEGRRTLDLERRKQLYAQFQKLIIEDAPHIWIYANLYSDFVSTKVKGVVNRPGYGASYLHRWWIAER